jgi:hypothetical protein
MPSPRRVFSLRLPPSVRGRLDELAEQCGISLNQYVATVLADHTGVSRSVLRSRASSDREPELEARAVERRAERALQKPPPPSRNAPCPCGSGKKFKRCCGVGGGVSANNS